MKIRIRKKNKGKGRLRRLLAAVLMSALLAGHIPIPAHAYAEQEYLCHYTQPGGIDKYTYTLDDALIACYNNPRGGMIELLKDCDINIPDYIMYKTIKSNTSLVIREGVTLTINSPGMEINGKITVFGTLDMQNSKGILTGNGTVEVISSGKYLKKEYQIEKTGDTSLSAREITYGQRLGDTWIPEECVEWRSPIEGEWKFVNPDLVPQAGERKYDVVFQPKHTLTYDPKIFPASGKVTVRQAVPKRELYIAPTLHYGQNLLDVRPEYRFISPVNSEEVPGEFTYETENWSAENLGEQTVMSVFTPNDNNYSAVRQYVKVNVVPTEPEIQAYPQARSRGSYGQTLEDIALLGGKCTNPYNGTEVGGKWEWKDPSERLKLGEHTYTALFVPEKSGYEMREEPVTVTTLPKVMEDISWPESSAITYGESLSESELSFTKNEYGTFAWVDEREKPDVKNKGARVVFTPADTEIYDWSRLAGYREEDKTVTFTIPIQVMPLTGVLPKLSAGDLQEGQTLEQSPLQAEYGSASGAGIVMWQEPEKVVTESGNQTALFLPDDSDNYNWSFYEPDALGRIAMPVYVEVHKKEIPPTASPSVSPSASASPSAPAVPSASSAPFQSATDSPVPLPTASGSNAAPDGLSTLDSAGIDSPVIVTRMADKRSTIRKSKPKALSAKSRVKKIIRRGGRAKLICRKVKKLRYEVEYSRSRKGKASKKKRFSKPSFTIKGLSAGKKYYFRVRVWKTVNGQRAYGKWSGRKKG